MYPELIYSVDNIAQPTCAMGVKWNAITRIQTFRSLSPKSPLNFTLEEGQILGESDTALFQHILNNILTEALRLRYELVSIKWWNMTTTGSPAMAHKFHDCPEP